MNYKQTDKVSKFLISTNDFGNEIENMSIGTFKFVDGNKNELDKP